MSTSRKKTLLQPRVDNHNQHACQRQFLTCRRYTSKGGSVSLPPRPPPRTHPQAHATNPLTSKCLFPFDMPARMFFCTSVCSLCPCRQTILKLRRWVRGANPPTEHERPEALHTVESTWTETQLEVSATERGRADVASAPAPHTLHPKFISHKIFYSFFKCQFPHNSVDLFSILVIVKDKLTDDDLCITTLKTLCVR